jgi:uncharacterized OB-fold protein
MSSESAVLSQSYCLGYNYTRTTGPVMGRFLTGLAERRIVGIKGSDGRVIVPPVEFDPVTADALEEFVTVANTGTVTTWCWVTEPRDRHPLDRPFAWALILLDGADTPMLHAIDAGSEDRMSTGMQVKIRWAAETRGLINDIACFVPADAPEPAQTEAATSEEITGIEVPINLDYVFTAGRATTRFLSAIRQGRIVGQKCPSCSNVFVPPRGSCAACGVATTEEVECSDKATVESFTIVHIPIPNNPVAPPYIVANLVVDGANISFIHLLSECVNEEVHIGQRVQAVWKPEAEWDHAMDNIMYFRPIDEPDVPVAMIGKGGQSNA